VTVATAFLDRDGTVNVKAPEGDYVKSWKEFRFLDGAPEAIRRLNQAGVRVVVVTNQRGIALGRMTEEDLADIHRRMGEELARAGAHVDAIYHCPHDHDSCDCRKPGVGMFLAAQADDPGISFAEAAVIGDSLADMEAGIRLGCRTILVGQDAAAGDESIRIDLAVASLAQAVDALLDRNIGRSQRFVHP
jgi:D-glycero-D-manno-heptose 1,7-bisphosphate phosphatase